MISKIDNIKTTGPNDLILWQNNYSAIEFYLAKEENKSKMRREMALSGFTLSGDMQFTDRDIRTADIVALL